MRISNNAKLGYIKEKEGVKIAFATDGKITEFFFLGKLSDLKRVIKNG